jgi:cytochrome P450
MVTVFTPSVTRLTGYRFYAFDVIGYVTFSMPFGFLQKGADVDAMIETIEGILFYSAVIGQIPHFHPFLLGNPMLPYLIPAMESWNGVVNFTVKAMSKRNDTGAPAKDILGKLKKAQVEKPDSIGYREIATHTSVNVFAGSDTTAIALRSVIYSLITHPRCYHKLQKEIDTLAADGSLSNPVQLKEANEMPYLQAVLKEAMRLHPSVGLIMERHVPKGGAMIAGRHIPEGTIVGINPWVLHRDKSVYGNDADSFRPERWLEANPEQLKDMDRCYLNFGAGSRTCIGKNISLMVFVLWRPLTSRKCRN